MFVCPFCESSVRFYKRVHDRHYFVIDGESLLFEHEIKDTIDEEAYCARCDEMVDDLTSYDVEY